MLSRHLRKAFLDYFKSRGHTIVPSSPVVPHDDPTLLFINAGMNQFKDVFLGRSRRDYVCAASSQKCIRVGGKHNDLENVGHTTRHLTFFEMLGNFSFGDYFKAEAIKHAWELTTQGFGLDPERLYVSVFREDDEAYELWTAFLPEARIVRLDERDNFWAMGDTGPCGPCSELLYDRGEAFGTASSPYEDTSGERFLEFWNLVFMEFNRDETGRMTALPSPCIDTGVGLERLVMLKMGEGSIFSTDILQALIRKVETLCGASYAEQRAAPFQVIADHLRSLAFAIADGVQPSNVERGYVLRKVLRRAVRYGRMLGLEKPFLADLLPTLIDCMGDDFPELRASQSRTREILNGEEESFLRTLRRGGNLLQRVVEESAERGRISGDDAFKLKDTYGLPIEEILLLARDGDLTVDLERYQELEQEARERSRAVHKVITQTAADTLFADLLEKHGASEFVGYAACEAEGIVVAILQDGRCIESAGAGEEALVLLNRTPFYAEKGGQVGDRGRLEEGENRFTVTDTREPYTGLTAHLGTVEKGAIRVGQTLHAWIDAKRRRRITHYHTATHLLHWALCKVLGPHVRQKGSVVAPDRLRFDFSHHKPVTLEEFRKVEDLVNEKISLDEPVEAYEISYAEAQKQSAIKQFFGDKYGERVRVVDLDYSKELCGGTHAKRTGEIGYFRIGKEGSVAAGVRRIEAYVGHEAIQWVRGGEDMVSEVADLLKVPVPKLLGRVSQLLEENTHYAREMKMAKEARRSALAAELRGSVKAVGQLSLIACAVSIDAKELAPLADATIEALGSGVVALACAGSERCSLVVRVSKDLVSSGIRASDLIKQVAPIIGGGGGGRPESAQAGGTKPSQVDRALKEIESLLEQGDG